MEKRLFMENGTSAGRVHVATRDEIKELNKTYNQCLPLKGRVLVVSVGSYIIWFGTMDQLDKLFERSIKRG